MHFWSFLATKKRQEREDALMDFRNGQARVLVATDVAARGLLGADASRVVSRSLSLTMAHGSTEPMVVMEVI